MRSPVLSRAHLCCLHWIAESIMGQRVGHPLTEVDMNAVKYMYFKTIGMPMEDIMGVSTVRPVARIFRRRVTWVCDLYVCNKYVQLGGCGGMVPQEIFRN